MIKLKDLITEKVDFRVTVEDRKGKLIQGGNFTLKSDANLYIKDMVKKHKLRRGKGMWYNEKTGVEMSTNFQEIEVIKLIDIAPTNKQNLNEKKKMGDKQLMNIKHMTDRNQHTENRRKLSSLMGNDKLAQFYKAMATLNLVFNGTNAEMNKLNQKMEKELYKQIRKSYANAEEIIGLL